MTEKTDADLAGLQQELQALREELAQLRAGAQREKHRDARDFAREVQAELKATLDQARERGQDALDRARDRGDKWIDGLEKKIEAYPLLSLCLMFLAGMLLASLLERRRED